MSDYSHRSFAETLIGEQRRWFYERHGVLWLLLMLILLWAHAPC